MCKHGDMFSLQVLIGRGLDLMQSLDSSFCSVLSVDFCFYGSRLPVFITVRTHLFPFRTQQLSSRVPTILGGKLPGKIGRCRYKLGTLAKAKVLFCCL